MRYRITPRSYDIFVRRILKEAKPTSPGGQPTYELINAALWTPNPRDRLVTNPSRKLNVGFGVLEFISLLTGLDDIAPFTALIASYDQFAINGKLDGCYGKRIVAGPGMSQIESVISILKEDPASRRAIISIYDATDTFTHRRNRPNTPCTIGFQFLIRSGELDMVTTMRSNDLYLGLPYDMFSFTLLQEYLAVRLNVGLGVYYHNAGSLHAYETDIPKLLAGEAYRWQGIMGPMPNITSDDISLLREVTVRMGRGADANAALRHMTHPYVRDLAHTMLAFAARKHDMLVAARHISQIQDRSLRHACYPAIPYNRWANKNV